MTLAERAVAGVTCLHASCVRRTDGSWFCCAPCAQAHDEMAAPRHDRACAERNMPSGKGCTT